MCVFVCELVVMNELYKIKQKKKRGQDGMRLEGSKREDQR